MYAVENNRQLSTFDHWYNVWSLFMFILERVARTYGHEFAFIRNEKPLEQKQATAFHWLNARCLERGQHLFETGTACIDANLTSTCLFRLFLYGIWFEGNVEGLRSLLCPQSSLGRRKHARTCTNRHTSHPPPPPLPACIWGPVFSPPEIRYYYYFLSNGNDLQMMNQIQVRQVDINGVWCHMTSSIIGENTGTRMAHMDAFPRHDFTEQWPVKWSTKWIMKISMITVLNDC